MITLLGALVFAACGSSTIVTVKTEADFTREIGKLRRDKSSVVALVVPPGECETCAKVEAAFTDVVKSLEGKNVRFVRIELSEAERGLYGAVEVHLGSTAFDPVVMYFDWMDFKGFVYHSEKHPDADLNKAATNAAAKWLTPAACPETVPKTK